MKKQTKFLFIPDTHAPYHDKKAFDLMLQVAKDFKPDTIVVLGDFVDCADASSHAINEICAMSLDQEIESASELLEKVEALKPKKKIYLEGNHEERLPRLIRQNNPAIRSLATKLNINSLLGLTKRGWEFFEYRDHVKIGNRFYATHDFGSSGKGAVLQAGSVYGSNVIFGHTHRLSAAYDGDIEHGTRVAINSGFLMDKKYVKYLGKVQTKDWQLGFSVGILDEHGYLYAQPVPIIEKNGSYFTNFWGKSYLIKASKK